MGVTTGLRAIRLAVAFLLMFTFGVASAEAPSGYACPPGVPDKGVGCKCPSGYATKRDESNIAICVAAGGYKRPVVQLGYDQLLSKANSLADTDCNAAEVWYVKALQQKPNGLEALTGSGMCMLELSKYASAQSRFRSALSVDPRYEGALWGVAEAYRKQGRKDDAITALKQYLDLYPSSYKAKAALEKLTGSGGTTPRIDPTPGPGNDPWAGKKLGSARTVNVVITGTNVSINGVSIGGSPMLDDLLAILGKPDRTWGAGSSGNTVYTWDKLGVVAYEPKDGRVVSLTMMYKSFSPDYDPASWFSGTITVDGNRFGASTLLSTVKSYAGATQPYSGTSVVFPKGDFNVFTQSKTESGPLDLVELSLWKKATAPVTTNTGGGGKVKTTQDVKISVAGTRVTMNGTFVSNKPMLADIEAIYGKPDNVWDQGSGNRVHTWKKLGLIVYEPRDGRAISATLPFKPMGYGYDPTSMFAGSFTVDGSPMSASNDLAQIKSRPGATQPYSGSSIVFDKGDLHVFTISKDNKKLDLVELSFWQNSQNDAAPVKGTPAPTKTSDVTVTITGTKVLINNTAVSNKPMVADFERLFGKPDRVWEKEGAVNRIHTWDKIGLLVYEPFDGRCISATFPFKPLGSSFDPKTMFGGAITVDGNRMSPLTTLKTVKSRAGATTPYGPTSVIFDKGDLHVFTNAGTEAGPIELVELSFWQKETK
jgi:hypothetical protein